MIYRTRKPPPKKHMVSVIETSDRRRNIIDDDDDDDIIIPPNKAAKARKPSTIPGERKEARVYAPLPPLPPPPLDNSISSPADTFPPISDLLKEKAFTR